LKGETQMIEINLGREARFEKVKLRRSSLHSIRKYNPFRIFFHERRKRRHRQFMELWKNIHVAVKGKPDSTSTRVSGMHDHMVSRGMYFVHPRDVHVKGAYYKIIAHDVGGHRGGGTISASVIMRILDS